MSRAIHLAGKCDYEDSLTLATGASVGLPNATVLLQARNNMNKWQHLASDRMVWEFLLTTLHQA